MDTTRVPKWHSVLVQDCLEVVRAGYERTNQVTFLREGRTLRTIGNYLLNRSGLGEHTFSLIPRAMAAYADRDYSLALMYGAGIDSYCALHHAINPETAWRPRKTYVIWMDYGQPYASGEYAAFKRVQETYADREDMVFVSDELRIIPDDAKTGLDWENYIIPARNLVLVAIGAAFAPRVWIVATNRGTNEEAGTPDKTSWFFNHTQTLCREYYNRRIDVSSPFFSKSKLEVVEEYLAMGGSLSHLELFTYSCYTGLSLDPTAAAHCGTCYACFKRHKLFAKLGYESTFRVDPPQGPNYHEFIAKEEAKGRS